jgi:hypothetical protein
MKHGGMNTPTYSLKCPMMTCELTLAAPLKEELS